MKLRKAPIVMKGMIGLSRNVTSVQVGEAPTIKKGMKGPSWNVTSPMQVREAPTIGKETSVLTFYMKA